MRIRRTQKALPAGLVVLTVAVGLIGAGCGAQADPSDVSAAPTAVTSTQAEPGPGGAPAIDWNQPVPDGVELSSLQEAVPLLSFVPATSPQLGLPTDVIVSPSVVPIEHRFVVMRFDHPELGVFLVQQQPLARPADDAQASLEALAGPCAADGCAGDWSLVALENGREALLVTGPGSENQQTNFLAFIDNERSLRIDIEGPPSEFSGAEALQVANALL